MQHEGVPKNDLGVHPLMYTGPGYTAAPTPWTSGLASQLSDASGTDKLDAVKYPHPVAEALSKRGRAAEEAKRMRLLAATEGLHAPLRLYMERRIMNRIQPRLPGLHSYHPLAAQLDGLLDEVDVEDFLNPAVDSESVGQPHLMMERKLGIL